MTGQTSMRFRDNVRGILSSVAQQLESHGVGGVHLPNHHHLLPGPPRRIRYSKGVDGRDKDKEEEGDNSLHFTDTEEDDFGEFGSDWRNNLNTGPGAGSTDNVLTETLTHSPVPSRTLVRTRPQTNTDTPQNYTQKDSKMQTLPEEEARVSMLIGMMGEGFDHAVVRRVLHKYDGDMDKAASALVEGDRGDDVLPSAVALTLSQAQAQSQSQSQSQSRMQVQTHSQSEHPQGRPNTPVIDLTLDEDADFQRAMQESMQSVQSQSQSQMQTPSEGPVFGPSERPSDPNWAMVPSDQADLERAIEASLEQTNPDALEPFPVEQQLRRDGCPVVLRPSMHTAVYATSILQGLFYVPQVRVRMASWRPPVPTEDAEESPPMDGPDYTLWSLSEIFTHMDLARLCDLNVDKLLSAFNIDPWPPSGNPGELSRKFFAKLAATLEKAFVEQFVFCGQLPPKPRILHFQYGSSISEPGELLQETSIVPIDVNGGEANDLLGCLSAQLSKPQPEQGKQSVIFDPSEVVAFELFRSSPNGNTAERERTERKLFTYPKSIYLDQFLRENVELSHAKRQQRREMYEEVQRLVLHKKTLTHFNGKETLQDLRSTIFYYENVAEAKDDEERAASIKATAEKLKGILTTIDESVKVTEEKIDRLRTTAETLLECEELQQYRYDLRVVFVHDGQYGRKHLYSYVHDKSCWWKIADSLIEKVPEEVVLSDEMGRHLNAGPYLLFYSRTMPENEDPLQDLPWPEEIKVDVRTANRVFLSQLPPELVEDIVIEETVVSPPSGVDVPLSSSSGSVSDVPRASGDGMDVS